jgi:hypothetical protein
MSIIADFTYLDTIISLMPENFSMTFLKRGPAEGAENLPKQK